MVEEDIRETRHVDMKSETTDGKEEEEEGGGMMVLGHGHLKPGVACAGCDCK